ncbi:MAG: hypothetical protein PHN56_04985, partial [Candidatus Nanoarchaeia archaeon]|nr:hypothetical protein [Candidatus Nanoarchaeia archaeon]
NMVNKSIKLGETARFNIKLSNILNNGLPSTVAVIGIPGGLSLQSWQLKELKEKNVFDFYEISGNLLILYFRQMKPNEIIEVNLDLKSEIKGNFEAIASRAYLYYTNEHKYWKKGETIIVKN